MEEGARLNAAYRA
jgi:hypothetical protein